MRTKEQIDNSKRYEINVHNSYTRYANSLELAITELGRHMYVSEPAVRTQVMSTGRAWVVCGFNQSQIIDTEWVPA